MLDIDRDLPLLDIVDLRTDADTDTRTYLCLPYNLVSSNFYLNKIFDRVPSRFLKSRTKWYKMVNLPVLFVCQISQLLLRSVDTFPSVESAQPPSSGQYPLSVLCVGVRLPI
jgi:hypothetical protein